ncbi:hypothetical protein NG798_20660 [Ancylothrix sp. C2]|uniref:hypothetical protein n=1 Tax=Ancylothrix sp. D3o TaxID=2953691 RepID=UPI0021BA4518|nr:hypothetical protein [Ancylothrix sp. D3o]MCT7952213.1 hypothetical protein [Ancylothrix sp. D3o]
MDWVVQADVEGLVGLQRPVSGSSMFYLMAILDRLKPNVDYPHSKWASARYRIPSAPNLIPPAPN